MILNKIAKLLSPKFCIGSAELTFPHSAFCIKPKFCIGSAELTFPHWLRRTFVSALASPNLRFCIKTAFSILILLALAACNKMDDNGDLEGNWQLTEWRSNADGQVLATNHTSQIYYTVRNELLKLHDLHRGVDCAVLCRFHRTADSLFIDQAYQRPFDTEIPPESLYIYGVTPDGAFRIQRLTPERLILRNEDNTLVFRKY